MPARSASAPSRTSPLPPVRRRRPRCNSTLVLNPRPRTKKPKFVRRPLTILALLLGVRLFAAEVIPPAPVKYFNDYAGVTAGNTAAQLNQTLENFEKEASSQIVVAVFS